MKKQILVLHGPNLNRLGLREPQIYGHTTLAEINQSLQEIAAAHNLSLQILQSNHEGALIDAIHAGIADCAGILINPAGLTHTSVSLRDALSMCELPVVEVHLTNTFAREGFRQMMMTSAAATAMICGLGWRSYTLGLMALVELLSEGVQA